MDNFLREYKEFSKNIRKTIEIQRRAFEQLNKLLDKEIETAEKAKEIQKTNLEIQEDLQDFADYMNRRRFQNIDRKEVIIDKNQ